jgi:DNA mismatch repair ATPase MutS
MSIAEIDASLSVAKLVNEFKDQPVRYSFVDFTQTATPCVDIGEFWNPFVDPNVVVPNTLKLGADFNCANIVVTGPNSGGKSTVLKSIALALVMGQSLGIAPAAKASMTPFHYVATYMGITDDITDKASLHQAEVDRATRMASMIDHMPRDQFSFVMFDELFNGTNPNEGTSLAYATAEVLGKMPHCVSIIASHYPYITMLESKTGRHKNYRVSVDETRDVIKRHYKLEPGISHQQIGIKVARERGCSGAIIDRAEEVLEELKNQKK